MKEKSGGSPMEKFQNVVDILIKHHKVLGYSFVSLLTAGGERLFSSVVFQCPCSLTWNLPYSLIFLLVPALILFLLGCLLSTRAKILMTGCCSQSQPKADCEVAWGLCYCITLAATVAPVTWIAVALLGGGFYECAASGSVWMANKLCNNLTKKEVCLKELFQVPCQKAKETEVQDLLKVLKAHSQVSGWTLIALVVMILLIFTSITRCQSSVNFLHHKFWKIYCKKEHEVFMNEAKKHATTLAEENVKCFFDDAQPKECKVPSSEHWKEISILYAFDPRSEYYSTLHEYVNTKDGNKKEDCNKPYSKNVLSPIHFLGDSIELSDPM